ncbi:MULTISPECIES: hypothetical protein [unclassified Bradyrhizobium]|uniref:hypothetical protein n=1 Tax=unclassified Bradyrhizobium TaxID=2631580 RepID=UPI002FEECD4A
MPYTLKAAALAAGTLLTMPYLFMYDMMVLAIPIGFLVRTGLKTGFRAYELPALGAVVALIVCYMFTGIPTGLGATLVVVALILRRAGPCGGMSRRQNWLRPARDWREVKRRCRAPAPEITAC